jgi:DNA polymerase III epsilon subunit-like protein
MATSIFHDEQDEQHGLAVFVDLVNDLRARSLVTSDTRLVTFNGIGFDVPVLITRCRLLGIKPPALDLRKYGSKDITDVMADLCLGLDPDKAIMRRSQKAMAARFGIASTDTTSGADVAAMAARGDYEAIAAHCQADIDVLRELFRRVHGAKAKGILLDLETCAIDNAAEYRAYIKPDGRVSKPDAIEASITEKLTKAALDPYLCRIVCLGWEVLA